MLRSGMVCLMRDAFASSTCQQSDWRPGCAASRKKLAVGLVCTSATDADFVADGDAAGDDRTAHGASMLALSDITAPT